MDPTHQDEDGREVTEQSRSFEVARTDEGWGVWDRRQDPGEPLAMYPPSARGFEEAYERFTRLNRVERIRAARMRSMAASLWVALVSGLVWILTIAIFQIRINLVDDPFESAEAYEALQWANSLSGIAYPVFLVAFALHVMLWMKSRDERG